MRRGNGLQEISLERIYRLFELAEKSFPKRPERSKRYVEIARNIGKKNSTVIPTELKKKFCKKCGAFLKKGKNAKWGKKEKWVEITCKECGFTAKRKH